MDAVISASMSLAAVCAYLLALASGRAGILLTLFSYVIALPVLTANALLMLAGTDGHALTTWSGEAEFNPYTTALMAIGATMWTELGGFNAGRRSV